MHVARHKPSRSPQLRGQVGSRWRRQCGRSAVRCSQSIRGECAKLAVGSDWDGVNVVNGAIMALAKRQRQKKMHCESRL